MEKVLIYTFNTNCYQSIFVNVFIKNSPKNSIATVHSTVEFDFCSWFIVYSVQSGDGRIEYFYEKFSDSNERTDYVLNIDYDSSKAICSFDSTERIVFVNSNNEELRDQNQPGFYEYVFNMDEEFKIFLVIFQNNIVLFWNNNYSEVVIVKTLDFSSCLEELYDYDLTRVVVDQTVDFLYENNCKITFCTDPSDSNTYFSAYIDIESFLESNDVSVVLKCHRFNQMCCSQFSGSQFKPNTDEQIDDFTLRLSHFVNGSEVVSEEDSDKDSEEGSEENSDEDSEEEE